MTKEERDQANADMRESATRNKEKIGESEIFISLFSDGMEKDPLSCMQLGMAIMMDKPIMLVGLDQAKLPKHLVRLASFVANTNSVQEMEQELSRGLKYMNELLDKDVQ